MPNSPFVSPTNASLVNRSKPADSTLQTIEFTSLSFAHQVHCCFLRLLAHLLQNYRKYLFFIADVAFFNATGFLAAKGVEEREFYRILTSTRAFAQYIDQDSSEAASPLKPNYHAMIAQLPSMSGHLQALYALIHEDLTPSVSQPPTVLKLTSVQRSAKRIAELKRNGQPFAEPLRSALMHSTQSDSDSEHDGRDSVSFDLKQRRFVSPFAAAMAKSSSLGKIKSSMKTSLSAERHSSNQNAAVDDRTATRGRGAVSLQSATPPTMSSSMPSRTASGKSSAVNSNTGTPFNSSASQSSASQTIRELLGKLFNSSTLSDREISSVTQALREPSPNARDAFGHALAQPRAQGVHSVRLEREIHPSTCKTHSRATLSRCSTTDCSAGSS